MEQIRRLFRDGSLLLMTLLLPAAKSVRQNVGLAALSVVLAFVLWIFVVDSQSGTTRTGTLPNIHIGFEKRIASQKLIFRNWPSASHTEAVVGIGEIFDHTPHQTLPKASGRDRKANNSAAVTAALI